MERFINDFLEYLDHSPCSFQAAEQSISRLARAGFGELPEDKEFILKPGGKYYVRRNDSAVIAFVMGSKPTKQTGIRLAASHLDSPLLKLKPETIKTDNGLCRIAVEVYGGPIIHTWTDRELSIAGRVVLRLGNGSKTKLKSVMVNLKAPLAIIPNAAIHLNRDVNKGFEYNKQSHLQAYLSTSSSSQNPLIDLLAKELHVEPEHIGEMDLYLYDVAKAAVIGTDKDMISSGRLDNLAMSHAIVSAFCEVKTPKCTTMAVLYDNEEIGSQTLMGAQGSFLGDILERISIASGLTREEHLIVLKKSFLISADMAHAFHPSYAEKYDPAYAPAMNGGPVIKMNANYRYSTTSESASEFIRLCEKSGISCQKFMTRSDLPCGSTIGPIASSLLGIKTIDIGNPMWAMHSIRETCGVKDHCELIKVLGTFYKE
ncbi:MAG: M18 family aminopeptidase [Candidatus Cloacimonadaceae bacterium]|nr:M18 family aminopeptidase [Candidatus Cloacimonadaceae bacterium]